MRGKDRRICLVILDGMADRPAPGLDGRTPLEAAETPNLDRLAAAGENGLMDVGPPGTPLSSDLAHTYLFGYDPAELPGRGVLEARGFDLAVPDGGVACSASFATLDPPGEDGTAAAGSTARTVADRHLPDDLTDYGRLGDRVDRYEGDGTTVTFAYTWKNRGIVRVESPDPLSPAVTDVDPFEASRPVIRSEPTDDATDRAAAERTADTLAAYTRWSADRLADAPADVVLSKWAGQPTDPEPFAARHGLDATSLTPKPVLTGLVETLSMTHRSFADEYDRRADQVLSAVDEFSFVHAHYPEPDEVAHAAGPTAKRDELERIDRSLEPVVERATSDPELVTVVTADHTTPSTEDVVHSGAPVPVTMVAESLRPDDVDRAGERPASRGGLGRVDGRDLLRIARSAADRMLLDGLRRSPAARDYPNQDLRSLDFREGS